ncbi:MAG: AAA family ATPase [Fimbriimonadaceae bacterium]
MLKAVELENFRAFSKQVRFDFKPITVLIGRNNSGKSTLLKWLQMARQSVRGTSEHEFLCPNGDHVALGAWNDARNKAVRHKKHRFALRLETRLLPLQCLDAGKPDGQQQSGRPVQTEETPLALCSVRGDCLYQTDEPIGLQEIVITNRDGGHLFSQTLRNLRGSGLLRPQLQTGDHWMKSVADDLRYLDPMRRFIGSVKHLSALRMETRSVIDNRTPPRGDVGHMGENTIQHLVAILSNGGRKTPGQIDFILRHSRSVLNIDDLKIRRLGDGLVLRPEGRNMDTKAKHRLGDFGLGVSQALPVFVQGAIMEDGELLTVEQPEAQLHPTVQLELGSFFAELWKERGVASIIETHSGNILLRLRRLVREGYLEPGDVGVCYCTTDKGRAEVVNMNVKNDGELDGHLPMEFFGADIFEALEFNAIAHTSGDHRDESDGDSRAHQVRLRPEEGDDRGTV